MTVTLERPPRPLGAVTAAQLRLVERWIELNREAIETYWNGGIEFTEDLIDRIKPV